MADVKYSFLSNIHLQVLRDVDVSDIEVFKDVKSSCLKGGADLTGAEEQTYRQEAKKLLRKHRAKRRAHKYRQVM